MNKETLDKIRSRGYWRINFEPLSDALRFKTLVECREAVEKNSVSLRGWDYPHIPRYKNASQGVDVGKNYYEGWTDWNGLIELWRMYQSSQFINFFAVHEDWLEDDELEKRELVRFRSPVRPMEVLNLLGGVTYQLTEVFQFLSRLTASGTYEEGARVSISLHNAKGRKLWLSDPTRLLFDDYTSKLNDIEFSRIFARDELLRTPNDCALETILYVVTRFGWDRPSVEVIKQDQENLVQRRL